MLCAPLVVKHTKLGVIYADSPDRNAFNETHLSVMRRIAEIASDGFEPTRYVEWLEAENRRLNEEIEIRHDMIGQSAKMREVVEFIRSVAPSEASVLILGESGTGKELVVRAIHRNSFR